MDAFAGIGYAAVSPVGAATVLYKFWMNKGDALPVFGVICGGILF